MKLTLLLLTALFSLSTYAQDRIQLENGELLGYITLVNDSILKFKVNKDDKSEYTLKRKAVLSYAYAEPVVDTTGYKHFYIVRNNKDTLIKHSIGDNFTYQLMGQCEKPPEQGRIIKLRNDRVLIIYKRNALSNGQQREVLLSNICYVAKPHIATATVKAAAISAVLIASGVGIMVIPTGPDYTKIGLMDNGIKVMVGN